MMIGALKVPGTAGFKIGFDLAVSMSMDMPSDDLSGNTSDTTKADKGIKAKRVQVAFSIRSNRVEELLYWSAVLAMLEARDDKDQAKEYVVIHPLVQASRIRVMRPVGQVRVSESHTMCQYDVSFELEEVKSVPEATESRSGSRSAGVADNLEAALKKIEAQAKT